ncbi:hypothetical protein UFOVP464_13 [uncultured Caudovirales phage]|uniref:DUF3168 domain-containing protein n=1 Tax=uncultured Caudovirales phage TaxID=2100421 RepID=A0A6J5QZP4_9CAUD|nr:hypothetical protein UFOVP464_13 [uncultured Caudovirales phage]CAB4189252.1 hypothetical protein UFOVP1189_28 [uncultured Caudovirales phage]
MSSTTAILKAVRDALVTADPSTPVYVAGSVPGRPVLPYIIASIIPSTSQRIANDANQGLDGIQLDAIAPTLAAAADLADAIDNVVLGLGSVAVDTGGNPTGLERASGSWRTVFPTDPATEGDRAQRVAVLYSQIEFRG